MRKFIFHILIACLVFPAAAHAQSTYGDWCQARSVPKVNVVSDTDRINWVFDHSEKLLNRADIDTVNPYGDNVITDVGGLMQGGIKMAETMQFNSLTNPRTHESCMFYNSVNVSFHIFPTIYIASEHPPGTCMHNAIKQHELKHINTDREIVNKYSLLVGQAIKAEITRQNIYGPFPTSNMSAIQQQMKTHMEQILVGYSNAMDAERRKRQQQIDSLPEYERVNHLCDEFR